MCKLYLIKQYTHILFLFSLILLVILFPQESNAIGFNKKHEEKPKKQYQFHRLVRVVEPGEEGYEEFLFEKIHKADHSTVKNIVGDDQNAEDAEEEEEAQATLPSFDLFGWLFGGSKTIELSTADAEQTMSPIEPEPVSKSEPEFIKEPEKENGIINWLQSMSSVPANQEVSPSIAATLIQYVDRWPFNAVFPIGKPEKIFIPKKHKGIPFGSAEPISDEHFTSILETFPSFFIDPNYIGNIDCKQQLQILERQLRGHKIWPLQMLDSSGKIPSGILRGNINQYGDFDMCTQIKTIVKVTQEVSVRIKGKYCLAHIEIQSSNDDLKLAVHLAHGRGLWNSHLGDPPHFAPRYSIVNWAICVPNLCPADVVMQIIDQSLKPYNHTGINFHVEVDEQDCYVRNSTYFRTLVKKNGKVAFTVGYFIVFLSFVITATIIENNKILKVINKKYMAPLLKLIMRKMKKICSLLTKLAAKSKEAIIPEEKTEETKTEEENIEKKTTEETNEEEDEVEKEIEEEVQQEEQVVEEEDAGEITAPQNSVFREIILSFSPNRSVHELLSSDRPDTKQFVVFHLLRIICTFGLYVCLKYLMIGHLPTFGRDKLVKSLDTPLSILFRSPLIYLDILLIISGFIKSYQMCLEMEEKSHIYVLKRMTSKIIRYLPTLYAVIFFQTWILPHLGSGPLWGNLIGRNSKLCEENMWRNLFGVQNVINVEETCSPMTIQHSVELQLYLLAPLIVWLFYCNSDVGFIIYSGIHAMSVAGRYSRTNIEHLSSTIFHGIHVSKFYRTANLLYASPITRATPFLIGIGAGILHRTSGNEWKDMSKVGLVSGWITAILSILWCFWSPLNSVHSDYIYNSIEAASYASWSPLLLGLGIGWIIFMIPTEKYIIQDDETIIVVPTALHRLLTVKPILLLSRISFPTQLISYVVVVYSAAELKEANRYTVADLINFSEIATILIFSIFLSIVIDIPIKNIGRILLDKLLPDKPPSNMEDELTDDEIEEHEEVIGDAVETPEETKDEEPIEDIWGSDPEEEEKKYLSKRNSLRITNGSIKENNDTEESLEMESDIVEISELKDNNTTNTETEEEDEEIEISEEEEVKKRPETPEKPDTPPLSTYRRRRLNN